MLENIIHIIKKSQLHINCKYITLNPRDGNELDPFMNTG